jgi:hypothetical protein
MVRTPWLALWGASDFVCPYETADVPKKMKATKNAHLFIKPPLFFRELLDFSLDLPLVPKTLTRKH